MATETKEKEVGIEIIQKKVVGMMGQVIAIIVNDEAGLAIASEMVADVKKLAKLIEERKEKFTEPAKAIIATAKETYDPHIAKCKEAETILKGKAQTFMLAERKRAAEEMAKIEKKAESGYIKPETAIQKMAEVKEAPKTAKAESSSLTLKMRKDVEIVDQSKIPDEFYKPRELDMVKLRKVVTAGVTVPGAKMIEVPDMASRS